MAIEWNDQQVALLKREWAAGKTASQIARLLGAGATRSSVIGKAHRLGLAGRPSPIGNPPIKKGEKRPETPKSKPLPRVDFWTAERLGILHAGYKSETARPVIELAQELGCSLDRLYTKVSELGLVHPTRALRIATGPEIGTVSRSMSERLAARAPKVAPDSLNLPLEGLKPGTCRFPTSPHMARDHTFCGAETGVPGSPYCPYHHGICFRPVGAANDDAPARAAAE